jgi:hypothetical protein
MKTLLALVFLAITLSAENWNHPVMIQRGYHFKVVCEHNILIEQMLNKDEFVVFEQPYCIDYSGWDGDCNHKPLNCKEVDLKSF